MYVNIEGIIVDPKNNFPERGVIRDGGNGVKHVHLAGTAATPEAVASAKADLQKVAKKYEYTLVRTMTKKVG